jgi:hypothetical protein
MPRILALWNASPRVLLTPPRVFQELEFGEDVTGLIDLPIHEMIASAKQIFPQTSEKSGAVEGPAAVGRVNITWSWQWLRLEYTDLTPDEFSQVRQLGQQHGCGVFDAETGQWTAAAATE